MNLLHPYIAIALRIVISEYFVLAIVMVWILLAVSRYAFVVRLYRHPKLGRCARNKYIFGATTGMALLLVLLHSYILVSSEFGLIHLTNIVIIILCAVGIEIIRLVVVVFSKTIYLMTLVVHCAIGAVINASLFSFAYVGVNSDSRVLQVFAMVIVIASIGRVFKYRFVDDFTILKGSARLYPFISAQSQYVEPLDKGDRVWFGNVLMDRIFDKMLRSYVFVVLCFALICNFLVGSDLYGIREEWGSDVDFTNSTPSGNVFVDFLYYAVVTVTTVGYGDVTPRSVLARIVASIMIIAAYLLFAALIAVAVASVTSFVDPTRYILKGRGETSEQHGSDPDPGVGRTIDAREKSDFGSDGRPK